MLPFPRYASVCSARHACWTAVSLLAATLAGAAPVPLQGAELQASPPAVRFAFERGGNLPSSQMVVLTSSAEALSYSIAIEGTPWLSLNAAAGATPGSLMLSVDPTGLAAGEYTAAVVFRPLAAPFPELRLPVTLAVTVPSIVLDADSVNFDRPPGSAVAVHTASVLVRRATPGLPLSFTAAASAAPWLTVETISGAATPGSVRLTANSTGLPPGMYIAEVVISAPEAANGSLALPVRLNVRPRPALLARPSSLAFSYQAGATNQLPRTLRVTGSSTPFEAAASTTDGVAWLAVDPASGSSPAALSVTIEPEDMEEGSYRGAVRLQAPSAADSGVTVPVTLNVTTLPAAMVEPASLSFEALAGSTLPLSQPLQLATNGAIFRVSLAANGFPWLSIPQNELVLGTLDPLTAGVFADPRAVNVFATPTGLAPGVYRGSVVVTPATGGDSVLVPVTLTVRPNRLIVPQVADGAGWQTTFFLVNTDREPAPYTLRFFAPDGAPLPLPVEGAGVVSELSGTLPVGGMEILRTSGADPLLLQGWAEITARRSIGGTAVFRQRTPNGESEAALPLVPPPAGPLSLPFDNSEGFSTALALVNSGAAPASVQLTLRDESGAILVQDSLALSAGARLAFSLPTQYPLSARRRGVLALSAASAEIVCFGLRFNPRASFTSVPPAAPVPASGVFTSAIPQIADAKDWKTTFVLTNPGLQPVPFSLNFRRPDGSPLPLPLLGAGPQSEYADTVPAGGVRILQTAGVSSPLVQGSAELVSGGPLTGVAVFRQRSTAGLDSEGALGIAPSSASRVVLPFDNQNGFQTAVAVVVGSAADSSNLSILVRDEAGNFLGPSPTPLGSETRFAFRLIDQFPSTKDRRGTLEISGTGFSAFALRFNPAGSFTAIAPLAK